MGTRVGTSRQDREGKDEQIVVMKVSAGGYEKLNGMYS